MRFSVRLSENIEAPTYEDWSHDSSDNSLILSSSEGSPVYDLKTALQKEILTFCRHPLPKRYYLTMKPYPDRQTTAMLRNFSKELNSKRTIVNFENMEARIFQRTLNEPCSNNLPMVLKSEPNSFFCTINTPLVTEVFKEFLTDSYVDQKDEKCDKARRVCQLCMMRSCGVKHIDWNMGRTSSELMCECVFTIQIQVAAKSHATLHPIVCATSVENAIRWIVICKIKANFAFVDNIPDVEVAILIKNTPTGATNSEYFLVDLQRRGASLPNNNSIELFRQREEKYVTFQNIKPFQFNTENWHKHGCAVDMSNGVAQEQVVENATGKIPVTVRIIPPKRQGAPFSYIIHEKDRKVQLRLSAKADNLD
ncbi:unnamed protein product [Hymenolepis diminuta]|uniref:Helitron_like_N domain-containing protein n=1 Tax=Hymenolepis diminuta TaxID=6216 RepID=A0A158QEA0_HYMDI|nr:unnamed protein product [Hymenolepis diminuta]